MFFLRSDAINGFERLVYQLGVNPQMLLQRVGLSSAQLRNPNGYLSYQKVAELLELASQECNEPLFGFHLANAQTSLVIGDLALSMAQQPTLLEALRYAQKYLFLHANGLFIELEAGKDLARIGLQFNFDDASSLQQLAQLSLGQVFNVVRDALQYGEKAIRIAVRQVSHGNVMRDEPSAYQGQIVFGAEADCVTFPVSWLDKKPYSDSIAVKEHLQRHIRMLEARYPNNLQDQVRALIFNLLPSGECCLDSVAKNLDMHIRVLQNKLQEQGMTFSRLLREVRHSVALQHLRYKTLNITELALNLGYAEVSVFSRNFKSWEGKSPRQWLRDNTN
jgi:AraC-like DNA-binding protein